MLGNYWTNVMASRVSRRRALAVSGGTSLAAAFLAACGGSNNGSTEDATSALRVAEDTTAKAVPGGTWQTVGDDALVLDPTEANSLAAFTYTVPVYEKLVKFGRGLEGKYPSSDLISGEVARSWEISGDGLTLTFKIAPDHKFDPRPPTSGRMLTAEDIKFSWDRMAAVSSFRGEIVNSVDPAGPVSSLSTPDNQTVVVKLAYPYGPIVEMFAYYPYLNIIPVEADGKFNPRQEMRGSGPFRLMEYAPSSHWAYTKNPDWYVKGHPFLDGIRRPIITEYSSQLAQFEAGALWDLYEIRQADVLRTKQNHPQMVLQADADGIGAPQDAWWCFSQEPNDVFRDVRVRRAASMMIDRDLWIDTYQNLPQFRDAGLPVNALWNSHMRAGTHNWLDPKTNALGEGAKFFQHNPAEAKKLVQAAGYTSAVKSAIAWHNNGTDKRREEITHGMISDGNVFDLRIDVIDYNTAYRDRQRTKGAGFEGMEFFMNAGFNEESWLGNMYTPGGKRALSKEPIPKVTDMVTRVRAEQDPQRFNQLIKDIQKELALDMSNIIFPGFAVGFNLHWPWLQNYGVFTSGDATPNNSSSRSYTEYWYDKSKQI